MNRSKAAAPWRCAIPDLASMEFMGKVTALQLAQLAANLKTAGIIPFPREPEDYEDEAVPPLEATGVLDRKLVLEAAEFLALCNEVKTVLSEAQRWEDLKVEISEELEAIAKKSNYDRVPVKELIRIAGAARLHLTSHELATLNVTRTWEEMTSDEQAVEIFMHLSSPQFQGATLIPVRQTGEFLLQRSYLRDVSLKDAYQSERWKQFNAASDKAHAKGVSSETRTEEDTQPALELTGNRVRDNKARLQQNIADNEAARRKLCQLGIHPQFDTLLNIIISLREAKALRDSGLKRYAAMKSRQGEGKKAKGPKTERRSDGTLGKQSRDNVSGRFRKKIPDSVFADDGSTPGMLTKV